MGLLYSVYQIRIPLYIHSQGQDISVISPQRLMLAKAFLYLLRCLSIL